MINNLQKDKCPTVKSLNAYRKVSQILSEIEFWKMEVRFFDKLLRLKATSTGSEYGDRIAETLQYKLNRLEKDVNKFEEKMQNSLSTNGEKPTSEELEGMNVLRQNLSQYKKDLFSFAEQYGNPIKK